MASPALAMLAAFASRRSLFFFRARAFLPDIALEEWMVSRARASLCVEASQNVAVRRSAMGEKSRVRTYDRAFDFFFAKTDVRDGARHVRQINSKARGEVAVGQSLQPSLYFQESRLKARVTLNFSSRKLTFKAPSR